MTVYVQLVADRSLADLLDPAAGPDPDHGSPAFNQLVERLKAAYLGRADTYRQQLKVQTKRNADEGFGPPESGYPGVTITLDGADTELSIDLDLYTSLLDLYMFYGSDGLLKVEQATRLARDRRDDLRWPVAYTFVLFTRNVIALLVRQTLVELEAKAAASTFDRLGQVNRMLSSAVATFDVVREHQEHLPYTDGVRVVPATYSLRDRKAAALLYTAMRKAVDRREACSNLLSERAKLSQREEQAAVEAANESSPGWTSPDDGSGERAAARSARLKREEAPLAAELELALANLDSAQKELAATMPLALLVMPGLAAKVSPETMENALGSAISTLADRTAQLIRGREPGVSMVEANLVGPPESSSKQASKANTIDSARVENLYQPTFRLERYLVDKLSAQIDEHPACVALLEPRIWAQLVQAGVIRRDSFEYIVAHNWVAAVKTNVAEAQAQETLVSTQLRYASAALSILAIAAPPLALLATIANLGGIAHGALSASRNLAAMDQVLDAQLPELASAGYEGLARAGELAAERADYVNQLTIETIELLAGMGAGKFRIAKEIMLANGYASDLETLLLAAP